MNKLFFIVPALVTFSPLLMVVFSGHGDLWEHTVGIMAGLGLSIGILGLFLKVMHLEKKMHDLQNK